MEMTKSKCRSTKEFLKPNDEQDVDLVLISLGFVTPFLIRYSCFVIANLNLQSQSRTRSNKNWHHR